MLYRVLRTASSWSALGTIIAVFVVTLLQIYVGSLTGPILSGFYSSISSQNKDQFQEIVIKGSIVITVSAMISAALDAIVAYLSWQFRQTLTAKLHPRYFENYYGVQSTVDNSDQRISHDIVAWSNDIGSFISKVIAAPCTIIYYSIRTGIEIGWYAPFIIYGWFLLGYFGNAFLIAYLSRLIYLRDAYEGDFRYNHARIRNHAEALALSNGGPMELTLSTHRFNRVMAMGLRIIKWQLGLGITTNLFTYLITILNYVIVAMPILFLQTKTFASESEISGYVAKAAFDAISLASGLSLFLNLSSLLSDLIGFSNRLGTFIASLNVVTEDICLVEEVSDRIEFRNVTIATPTRVLIENLSFVCCPHQNLLILGPSGSGKTSIQRVLSGLWTPTAGTIYRPPAIYYLPANPYFPRTSLTKQITYPLMAEITNDIVYHLLDRVGLTHLFTEPTVWLEESDAAMHWTETLSNGERQRLAFARLLYHNPTFAVLDEATSALPVEAEAALYQQCQSITLISMGHRESLRTFHPQVLQL